MQPVNKHQITSQNLSTYLNSSVLDRNMDLFTSYNKPNVEQVSDLNTEALPFYPPISGGSNLLNISSNKSSFTILHEQTHPKSSTLNKLALKLLDEKDFQDQANEQEQESTISDYSPTPSLPTNRSFCKYDNSCTRPVCQYVHPIEWYKLSNHFTRIETIHMNEYNDIIKYKIQYPSLTMIYKSLSETHLKIAENAKADAEKFMSDNSHLTLNLKENLNFIESKGKKFNNTKKQYLDEAPKKIILKPYESGAAGSNVGTSNRLRPERPPRSQLRNTSLDSSNYASGGSCTATAPAPSPAPAPASAPYSTVYNTFYNDNSAAGGGSGSYVPKGRGTSSNGKMYSLEQIEAPYVYKQRDDLFASGKKNTEQIEKVHYPKVYDYVRNSQVNSSINWRES
jgi:hypothetical protein